MKKRRCLYGGLWVLSLVGISFYGGAVSYGFFFGVTLIPLVSLIYLSCVYSRFKIYQETTKRNLVCGQPEPYFFVLQNEDYFAYTAVSVRMHSSFSYAEDSFEDVEYELFPGDSSAYETKIVCKYRGEYEIGVKEVLITDFFRLFRFRYKVSGQIKALVSPRIVQVPELKSVADLPMLLQRDAYGSTEPDLLVRDYQAGDELKRIHWKATAREQKLKTRLTTGKENRSIALFCDTRRFSGEMAEYLPLENKILETFLAIGYFFAERNKEFSAYYGQNKLIRTDVPNLVAFDGLYANVSEIVFDSKERVSTTMKQALDEGLLSGSLVLGVVHQLDPELLEMTERVTVGGGITVLYLVTDEPPADWSKQISARRRIVLLPVEAKLEERL